MNISWTIFIIILFLLALAAFTAMVVAYFKSMRLARKRLEEMGSQLLEIDCGEMEVAQVGQGYPALVIHGALGGFDHGLWVANGFIAAAYQLICVSRFGYLRSDLPTGANLNMQADAYASILDALEIQKAIVFAVSAGSTSAIRFAARHPERVSALVLVGPDSPGKEQMPMPPRFIFEIILRNDFIYWVLCTFFQKWMQSTMGLSPKGFKTTPENELLMKKFLTSALPVSMRMEGLIYDSYTAIAEFNQTVTECSPYPLGRIHTPVLVIHALDDPLAVAGNVKVLTGLLPNAESYTLPNGGHLFFGHMQEVTMKILQFMQILTEK